jgi:hypothetical protein
MERPSSYVRGLPVCIKNPPPRVASCIGKTVYTPFVHTFKPMMHIDAYIRDAKLTGETEQLYRELYTPPPEPEPVVKETPNVPSDPLHVFTNMKVTKSGVKVKITVPMEPVYLAQRKGTLPSIQVRIKAAKGFGYSDEILTRMITNYDNRAAMDEKLDDFIESIFGNGLGAKTNKPKKKTNVELLNAIFKKKPAKKYS